MLASEKGDFRGQTDLEYFDEYKMAIERGEKWASREEFAGYYEREAEERRKRVREMEKDALDEDGKLKPGWSYQSGGWGDVQYIDDYADALEKGEKWSSREEFEANCEREMRKWMREPRRGVITNEDDQDEY